jgi:hypothetical protein
MRMDLALNLRRARATTCAVGMLLAACCLWAGTARAAGTVAATVGVDPVESIATQLGASGSVTDPQQYVVEHYKPSGGSACGANPDADNGTNVGLDDSYLPAGAYAKQNNVTFQAAGAYLVCAWLMQFQPNGPNTVVVADAKTITVRLPHLMLTLGVPAAVTTGQTFQVITTTQVETNRYLWVYVLVDSGRGCPANASAAASQTHDTIIDGQTILGGPTTVTTNDDVDTVGALMVCGYINRSYSSSDAPEATASASFTGVAPPPPPPPCVVPAVVKDEPLAQTKTRLAAASCTVGRVRYLASARYAHGSVFKVAPVAGTSLAHAAAVDLWVSSGAPCIVPSIPSSRGLSAVKRRLRHSGCTVGRVSHRHSRRVHRGRVIALGKPRGVKLSPRSTVGIIVSSGR